MVVNSSSEIVDQQLYVQKIPGDVKLPPLVFVHGWGTNSLCWQPLVDELVYSGEKYLVDLPGFGGSADVAIDSPEQFLERLVDVIPDKSILIGWSLGGLLSTYISYNFPQKSHALVTLAVGPDFIQNSKWTFGMPKEEFDTFYMSFRRDPQKTFNRFLLLQVKGDTNRKSTMNLLKQFQSGPQPHNTASWLVGLNILRDMRNSENFATLTQPCLSIFADQDALVSPRGIDFLSNNTHFEISYIKNFWTCDTFILPS